MITYTVTDRATQRVVQIYYADVQDDTLYFGDPARVLVTFAPSTDLEIQAAMRQRRGPKYPPLTDFADAFYDWFTGDASSMQAYIQACTDIKRANPFPNQNIPAVFTWARFINFLKGVLGLP